MDKIDEMIGDYDILYPLFVKFFNVFYIPKIRLVKPTWISKINKFHVFGCILLSYFFFTGGIIYDIILEPPSVGAVRDSQGRLQPQAIMPYRLNGQYMIEGFCSSLFFCVGALGFVLVDYGLKNRPGSRMKYLLGGIAMFILSYMVIGFFIRIKVPGYMR